MSTEEKDPTNKPSENETKQSAPFESRTDLSGVESLVNNIRTELGKIIVGQHRMVDLLIAALLADGHVLIEGVPGVAKTLTTKRPSVLISPAFSSHRI